MIKHKHIKSYHIRLEREWLHRFDMAIYCYEVLGQRPTTEPSVEGTSVVVELV